MSRPKPFAVLTVLLARNNTPIDAASGDAVQSRTSAAIEAGRPRVAHVIVALRDNKHQGIQPVPESFGNGQEPRSNLCWSALRGKKTYLPKHGGSSIVSRAKTPGEPVLERIEEAIDRFPSAAAYHKNQKCGLRPAPRLFSVER